MLRCCARRRDGALERLRGDVIDLIYKPPQHNNNHRCILHQKAMIFTILSSKLINFLNLASLSFQFQVNIFWSNKKKGSIFTCQFHYCDCTVVSADNPPPPYDPNLPACGGRSVRTFGISTWIYLHCTRTLGIDRLPYVVFSFQNCVNTGLPRVALL